MKTIKSYKVFEEEKYKKLTDVLNNDPLLKKWRGKIKVNVRQFEFMGEGVYDVTTAYEEILKLHFYDDGGEYTGEGDWDFTSTAIDQYGIKYIVKGTGKGYTHPDDVYWDEEESDSLFSEKFKVVKFIEDIIIKDPLVCSKIYGLVPIEMQEEIRSNLTDKGISTDILKGGSLLNRME